MEKVASRTVVPLDGSTCRHWDTYSRDYPRMKVAVKGKLASTTVLIHRLVFFNTYRWLINQHLDGQVSHLCHHRACINTHHLVLEPVCINRQRNICKRLGTCITHNDWDCCII